MHIIDNGRPPGVPIVGQQRTWKQVRVMPFRQVDPMQPWPQTRSTVKVQFPHGLYLTVLEAVRSDGEPVAIQVPFDKREFRDPQKFGEKLAFAFQHLHTFLNCACVGGRQCPMHRQVQAEMAGPAVPEPTLKM